MGLKIDRVYKWVNESRASLESAINRILNFYQQFINTYRVKVPEMGISIIDSNL